MAGGKLSARQKMINMMYLVLTALLALNVSAEILEAFKSLRDSIQSSAEKFDVKNTDTRQAIKDKVQDEIKDGITKNTYILSLADEVVRETKSIDDAIQGHITKLEEIAALDKKTGEMAHMKETEQNYQYWMGGNDLANGGRGNGQAKNLRESLIKYSTWANGFVHQYDTVPGKTSDWDIPEIVIEPAADINIPESNDNKNTPWEAFYLSGKPVIADIAMMEKFRLDVQNSQSELLNWLKEKLGAVTFKIDSLRGISAPVSRVVAAGMKFETELYVVMSSSEITPEFSASSGSVKVEEGGNSAILSIQAGGGFAKGQNEREQSYSAKIKVPKADGSVQELVIQDKFIVRKPEVVITSASVQNLYWNCGNTINADVPALGEFYNPQFKASSASIIKNSSDKRKVTIVPTGRTCVLSVSSLTNGQNIKIDDIKYKVIKPPKPSIVLMVNGKEYNGAAPIPKKSSCIVRVRPDRDFASALPKDARYMISRVDLLSARSLGAPAKVGAYNGNGKDGVKGLSVALGNKLKQDAPGTKIFFKIDNIYRINFQNKKVKENFSDRDLYVGATIK